MTVSNEPLIIEQEFNAPLELVWRAITEKELMQKWYFNVSDFKPDIGHKFQFEGGKENKRYLHLCEVLEVIPLKRLKYSWKYKGHEGLSFVTLELYPTGEKTRLKLTHEGLETFIDPDLVWDNFEEGWEYLIHHSLVEFLEKGNALRNW